MGNKTENKLYLILAGLGWSAWNIMWIIFNYQHLYTGFFARNGGIDIIHGCCLTISVVFLIAGLIFCYFRLTEKDD